MLKLATLPPGKVRARSNFNIKMAKQKSDRSIVAYISMPNTMYFNDIDIFDLHNSLLK